MTSGGLQFDVARLSKLREAMTDADLRSIEVRFKADRKSLSEDEVGVLYIWTREKIREFEEWAAQRRGDDVGSED